MFIPVQREKIENRNVLPMSLNTNNNNDKSSTSPSEKPWENSEPSKANIQLTREYLNGILSNVTNMDIKINNIDNYQLAFTHKSMINRRGMKSYETLEFIGDAFIDAIVAEYLYSRFPNRNEGFLTKLKTRLTRSETFAKFAFYLNFDKYILISTYFEIIGGRKNHRIMEDVFEAFCAAVKKDLGYHILEIFVVNLIELLINIHELVTNDDNFKDRLLRLFQKNGWSHPTYSIVNEFGPRHNTIHKIGVDDIRMDPVTGEITKIPGKYLSFGKGKSRKIAEQNASRALLHKLNTNRNFERMLHQRCGTAKSAK